MIRNIPSVRRAGFTLVEMMVVLAIIVVLVAILLPAVFKVMAKGDEVKARNDIQQLDVAVSAFKTEFKVDHLPSRFVLCERRADYFNDAAQTIPKSNLHRDSLQFLERMWSRLQPAPPRSVVAGH